MRQLQVLLVLVALIFLVACGGSGKTTVSITLTPATASVATTQNQQFAATVTNGSTSAVTWQVNGIIFGDPSTVGSINAAGLYTAPTAVPNPPTVTITAVPAADSTKSATATVTITLGANLAISPSSLTMAAGAQQPFTVTSNGTAASGVAYSLSCKTVGGCGSVTSAGVYTAPLSVPAGGNVILTATLTLGTGTFSTSATITIQPSAQTLTGQYAFYFAGQNGGVPFHSAGTISFDGTGNVTGGSEDVNSGGTLSTVTITSGTYTFVATQGRVQADLHTDHGDVTWYLVLTNRSHGFIEFGGSGASASGTLDLQDSTQFTPAAVNGSYTFRVSGLNTASPAKQVAIVGAFTADGAGNVTTGLLDANDGGTISSGQALSGTFTAPAAGSGRGTLTLNSGFGTQTFAYYVVDATRVKLVETDANRSTAGDAVVQANGPYATTDFHGSLVFVLSGMSANGTLGLGGVAIIGSGTITSGSIDNNDAGIFTPAQTVTGGNYAVQDAATGRTTGTVTLGGSSIAIVLYPLSDTSFNVLEADATQIASGPAQISSGASGTNSTLNGKYSVNLAGVVGTTQEDVVGQLVANGGGVITGVLDITNGGANTSLLSSPYSVSTSSTAILKSGFANFNSVGFNLYIVDPSQVFFLENDSKGVLTGVMQLQN